MSASVKPEEEAENAETFKKANDALPKSLLPISRIPWINRTSQDSSQPFEKSKLCLMMHADHKNELSQLFRLLNEIAPFYLPKRYYDMDIMALQELSSKSQVWSNFKHMLILQCWNGYGLFDEINNVLTDIKKNHKTHASNLSNIRSELVIKKEFLFKGIAQVEMCESAYNFLFEPWVLIQLPFKPVLLHQWLVAALAETLQFEKEISEFFYSPIPSSLQKAAKRLALVLNNLHQCILKAFYHLEDCTRYRYIVAKKPIIEVLETMQFLLEFVCSVNGKDMVKALKRKLAICSADEKLVEVVKESGDVSKFLYSLEFWLGKQTHGNFFKALLIVHPAWLLHSTNDFSKKEFLDYVGELAPQFPITDELKTSLLLEFSKNGHLRLVLLKYKFYAKVMADKVSLQECDLGVISNILTLQAEVHAKDALHELVWLLKPFVDLRPVDNNLSGPDFDLNQILKALAEAKGPNKEKNWFPTLFEQLMAKVNSDILKVGRPRLTIAMDLNKIANSLEVRIKFVVLKMARKFYTESLRKSCDFFWVNDTDLAYYLLPCLVVVLLELLQDPNAQVENKKWYLHFVDRLVKTFEMHELEIISTYETCYYHRYYLNCSKLDDLSVLSKSCERALAAIPAELISKGGALQQLRLCLEYYTTLNASTSPIKMVECRFFNRLQYVLDSLRPETTASEDNLMIICRVIASYAYASEPIGYKDDVKKTPDLAALTVAIFEICSKFKEVSFHRLKKLKPTVMADMVSEFKKEAEQLSQQQLLAILLHMLVNYNRREKQIDATCQKPTPFDPVYAVFHSYLVGDRWRLSHHLAHRLDRVQHQLAVQQNPVCYSLAIHEVSRKGKLKMCKPGEITFSPLKHCRWCGLVDVEEFLMCKMCQEDEGYRDANLFCSTECETEALRVQHAEEHARHLMVCCGIEM